MECDFSVTASLLAPDNAGSWLIDKHYKTTYINHYFARLLGYQADEMLTHHFFDFLNAADKHKIQANIAKQDFALAGKVDLGFQHKQGHLVYTQAIVWPIWDKTHGYQGLMLGLIDNGENHAKHQYLSALEQKLSLIKQACADAIIVHQGGNIIEVNAAACQLFELSEAELITKDLLKFIHAEDKQKVLSSLHQSELTQQQIKIISELGAIQTCLINSFQSVYQDQYVRVSCIQNKTLIYQANSELEKTEQTNHALIEHAPDAIVLFEPASYRILQANSKAVELFGLPVNQLLGSNIKSFFIDAAQASSPSGFIDKDNQTFNGLMRQTMACLKPCTEIKIYHQSGAVIECEIRLALVDWQHKKLVRASLLDIGTRKKEHELVNQLSRALEQTADIVLITDKEGVIEYANQAAVETTGFQLDEIIGQTPAIFKSGQHNRYFMQRLWQAILAGESFRETFINKQKNGQIYYEEKTISPLINEHGELTHFVSTGRDISERITAQNNLQFLAFHDVLTGLPNRALFNDRLKNGLANAKRHHKQLALLFFDIDHFKRINDSLGHNVGDILLKRIANKLRKRFRDSDTIARLGGDEFAVIMNDIVDEDAVKHTAEQIIKLFNQPIKLSDKELFISSSVGISIYPQDGLSSQNLLKHADIAMYRAKAQGRNTYMFYREEMNTHAFERLKLESELHRALHNKEFVLHYQPKICLITKKIQGVEALLRWQHPEYGLLLPEHFIPILESTGLIVPVGYWVIQQSLADRVTWYRQGMAEINLSINLSALQLKDIKFIESFKSMLADMPLANSAIEFEITESTMMEQGESTKILMQQLSALGINLSIDDFGTGYSSLAYLKRLPVQTIKIDRSFIHELGIQHEDEAIVKAVIAMAKSLDYKVVAEGVENTEQVDLLTQLGCDTAQGYLFSKAVCADEIMQYQLAYQHKDLSVNPA